MNARRRALQKTGTLFADEIVHVERANALYVARACTCNVVKLRAIVARVRLVGFSLLLSAQCGQTRLLLLRATLLRQDEARHAHVHTPRTLKRR
jgi:hypothetical protein